MLNRVPFKSVKVTPYEIWIDKKPYLSHMKVWGYPAYVKRTISDKLEAKSDKCLFIGYPKETIGYQLYNTWNKGYMFQSMMFSYRENFS